MTKNSVISLAVLVLAATAVQAQTKTTTLPNLRLVSTTLQVADAFQQISATCSTEGCTASTPVVKPINVLCPGSSGQTCIFKVHVVVGNLFATFNSIGAFQYVGDGTETPPEAGAGFVFVWQGATGASNVVLTSSSTEFVVLAKNQSKNQKHHVEVDLVCREEISGQGGCNTGTFPNILNSGDAPGPPATVDIQVFAH